MTDTTTVTRTLDGGYVRGNEYGDRIHMHGRSDDSPSWNSYRNYDADCSWCWLGHGHTENAHRASIAS